MVSSVQAVHGRTLRGISDVFVVMLVPEVVIPTSTVEFLRIFDPTENGNSAILYLWDCNGPRAAVLNMGIW